ncbi:MAG: hypothetical protein M0R06_01330 [Sphaerochaeta sp.]|jgi:flagellar motor switch protein FliG|nr:hypothetical protein [Sphaerochaeta sp.]
MTDRKEVEKRVDAWLKRLRQDVTYWEQLGQKELAKNSKAYYKRMKLQREETIEEWLKMEDPEYLAEIKRKMFGE